MSSSTSNTSCSMPSSSNTSSNRRFERGRWYSTVSALTSRKLILRNSQTRLMSRRFMWRTLIIGPGGFLRLPRPAVLGTTRGRATCSDSEAVSAAVAVSLRRRRAMSLEETPGAQGAARRGARKPQLGADPGGQGLYAFHERGTVMALELGPGGERRRVGAVDEQLAVEVVDLVLVGAGLEAVDHLLDRVALAVPGADLEVDVALHHAAQ